MAQSSSPSGKAAPRDIDIVIIRSYPKVIFFYPSVIVAAICCFFAGAFPPGQSTHAATFGMIFMIVFFFNVFVISFEFRTWVALLCTMALIALALLAYVINQSWNFLPALFNFLRQIKIEMSWWFYFSYTVVMLLIFGIIWVIRRFYYIEIKSNEVVYRQGLFGDVERHDTRGMKHTKEINDLLELLLLGAGLLVITVPGRREPYIMEHVPWVNRRERDIMHLTSRQSVEIEN
jgi:hypothetical protein